jgi:hypothetical protein
MQNYAHHCLGLKSYFQQPGDGREHAHIPARDIVWTVVLGRILRVPSFFRLEWLVHSPVRAEMGVQTPFGDDALGYCTERMDPEATRVALAAALRQAKRNKAFENSRFIGLALDGTGAGRTYKDACPLCDPVKDAQGGAHGCLHHFVMISIVGTGLTLPVDVEPYGAGDSEYAAAQRLLPRTVAHLGPRFADYIVGDGAYATAPFLHQTEAVDLPVVARLKENLPCLAAAVRARFDGQSPHAVFQERNDRVEVWDADDFDPWETLHWPTVRVLRYRQHKGDGTVIEAEWLTNFSLRKLGKEPLGDRESGLQRRQEPLRHGTYLPPRTQQHSHRVAVDPVGLGDRAPLPPPVSASRRSRRSQRHGSGHLSLVEPGFPPSTRHRLTPAPCGPASQRSVAL